MSWHSKIIIFFVFLVALFPSISCKTEFGFTEETVVFRNEIDGAILEGTLTIPQGYDNFPIAVFISGAGTQDRDERIYGHSLGAIQGTILAATKPEISFLVMLGGIGIPWSENHIKADSLLNTIKGENAEIVNAGSQLLRKVIGIISIADDSQKARPALYEAAKKWLSSLSEDVAKTLSEFTGENPEFWNDFADQYAQPIYLSCARYNPYPLLKSIECPVLSIIGENVVQVLSENNLAISKALSEGGNTHYTIHTPKNINHLMQYCETGLISEYEMIPEDFNENLLKFIADWINDL